MGEAEQLKRELTRAWSKLEEEKFKKECIEKGLDPVREVWKSKNINQLEARERKIYEESDHLANSKTIHIWFNFNTIYLAPELRAGIRYQNMTSKMEIDRDAYELRKKIDGEKFYPTHATSVTSRPKDNPEDVDKLVEDLNNK